jgi:hypothetical protein
MNISFIAIRLRLWPVVETIRVVTIPTIFANFCQLLIIEGHSFSQ